MPASRSLLMPVLATLLGLALFSAMDGLMKAASIALGAYSAILWRNLLGAGMMAPLWLWRRRRWPSRPALRLHLIRGTVVAGMSVTFFYGLVRTPMAEAMALSFIAPLIALYLAAVLLGEEVGRRAVTGSVMALGGVGVIALGKFSTGSYDTEAMKGLVAVLVSAAFYGWNLILQRQQAQLAVPEEIAFFQPLVVFAIAVLAAPWLAVWPAPTEWSWLAAAAVITSASLLLLSWGYARAEAQILVPLEYTAFIWAALVGWLAFGEPLTAATVAGVVLIVAGCLVAAPKQEKAEIPA